jgi:hypothetical protein
MSKPYSAIIRSAVHAAHRGPISFDAYHERIYVSGKFSPAVDQLISDAGTKEAWEILKENGVAFGTDSDKNIHLYYGA